MKDEILYKLFKEFVFEIYPLLDPTIDSKIYFKPKYDDYPSLKYNEKGMPEVSTSSLYSPPKITDLFAKWSGKADIELNNFKSYKDLESYLFNHEKYKDCILPENHVYEGEDDKFNILLSHIISDILERYYLLNKDKREDEKLLIAIYSEFENYVYADNLHFDIAIPILFLQFEQDEFIINNNIFVRRISDGYQKARYYIKEYSPPIPDRVITSATHELVFKNYYIKKANIFFSQIFHNEKTYPLDKFELFFNAIKTVTNYNSGFSQILVYPHGWGYFFKYDLPVLKGTSVKRYPSYFEDYYWNKESFPKLNVDETKEISLIYEKLLANQNNKISIASRRLRLSYLRDNEEDSILDIIIALETLLSDNEKGEITHKLALRVAVLISSFNQNYNAIEVFDAVKKIYGFRSSIVHGSSKINKTREIKLKSATKPIDTIELANEYLCIIIGILIKNPEYLDSKKIDELLLNK